MPIAINGNFEKESSFQPPHPPLALADDQIFDFFIQDLLIASIL